MGEELERRSVGLSHPPASSADPLADALRQRDPLFDIERMSLEATTMLIGQLRHRRERARVSQGAVAELMRTSQSVVSELESGAADPRLSTLRRYAAALGHCLSFEGPEESLDRRISWAVHAWPEFAAGMVRALSDSNSEFHLTNLTRRAVQEHHEIPRFAWAIDVAEAIR